MNPIVQKMAGLWPEIAMLIGACACMLMGLVNSAKTRRLTVVVALLALVTAFFLNIRAPQLTTDTAAFVKAAVALIGIVLLLVNAAVPDELSFTRGVETGDPKIAFDPALVMRGEFFAFFLFSLTGVMLCAGASDLVWLFLALELTSLPTYVMIATSRDRVEAHESAIKYFFLGAMAAAVFLYGFTLIYGATGYTDFEHIRGVAMAQIYAGGLSPLLLTGVILAVIGIAFKIAAVPMHFYTADVYQGAATPVAAFLAFVPKTAGFVSLMAVLGLVHTNSGLPATLSWLIWIMAALTMTVGNVLGLLQVSVKRILAYSSIAHSGYMLVGLLGTGLYTGSIGNGAGAVLFYLIGYGLSTIAAFAVLGCLRVRGEEIDSLDDLSGLVRREPILATVLLLSLLSLVGLPPMVGFLGKIFLFGSAIAHNQAHPEYTWLVVIAVLNSAVSAVYYLRIAGACFFAAPAQQTFAIPYGARTIGAIVAMSFALGFGVAGGWLVDAASISAPPTLASPGYMPASPPRHVHGVPSAAPVSVNADAPTPVASASER